MQQGTYKEKKRKEYSEWDEYRREDPKRDKGSDAVRRERKRKQREHQENSW